MDERVPLVNKEPQIPAAMSAHQASRHSPALHKSNFNPQQLLTSSPPILRKSRRMGHPFGGMSRLSEHSYFKLLRCWRTLARASSREPRNTSIFTSISAFCPADNDLVGSTC